MNHRIKGIKASAVEDPQFIAELLQFSITPKGEKTWFSNPMEKIYDLLNRQLVQKGQGNYADPQESYPVQTGEDCVARSLDQCIAQSIGPAKNKTFTEASLKRHIEKLETAEKDPLVRASMQRLHLNITISSIKQLGTETLTNLQTSPSPATAQRSYIKYRGRLGGPPKKPS